MSINPLPSQIRGVFYSVISSKPSIADWETIASTLEPYGINLLALECLNDHFARFPNSYVPYDDWNISAAITSLHNHGIAVYAHIDTMLGALNDTMNCYYLPNGSTSPSQVTLYPWDWLDIANPAVDAYMKPLIQQMISNYAFDGVIFDYTRWDDFMPLGDYDKTQFIADTGLSDVNWIADVVPTIKGGTERYYKQFMDWRSNLVTAFVGKMVQWAKEINPNLVFAASPHSYGMDGTAPDYWRWRQGQDFTDWIRRGYIKWVAPMLYNSYTVPVDQYYIQFAKAMTSMINNSTGKAHGAVPICPFLTLKTNVGTATVTDFVNQVNAVNAAGGDGWIIWCYTGPGSTNSSGYPNIRPFLEAIGMPYPTAFDTSNITVSAEATNAIIRWQTTLPANGEVEYNSSPLYGWVLAYSNQSYPNFPYWKSVYSAGTILSDASLTTDHTINVSGLATGMYVFQLRSTDPSGTATMIDTFEIGAAPTLTLISSPSGGGMLSVAEAPPYTVNQTIHVAATPAENYKLSGWLLDGSPYDGTGNPIAIVMDTNHTLTALFVPDTGVAVTVVSTPAVGGSVAITEQPPYAIGQTVHATATPAENYKLIGWLLDDSPYDATDNPAALTLDADHTLTALFESTPIPAGFPWWVLIPVGAVGGYYALKGKRKSKYRK